MREVTSKLVELAEEGILRWEDIARECLVSMSEDEVKDMASVAFFDWVEDEENDDD